MTRIGLVGCVKSKKNHAASADELYTSALFRGRRKAVEGSCDRWYILSTLHGIVRPDEVLEPYDVTLVGAPTGRKREWSTMVLRQLDDELGSMSGLIFEIHAGNDYCNFGLAHGLRSRDARVERPAEGLAVGEQLAFYQRGSRVARSSPTVVDLADEGEGVMPRRQSGRRDVAPVKPPRGKYAPLYVKLANLQEDRLRMSFVDIEDLLGSALPSSARG
jgi:hypothetical protein